MDESLMYNRNNGGKYKQYWGVFLFALFVLVCFYPYEFNTFYFRFLPDKAYITSAVMSVLCLFVLLSTKKGIVKMPPSTFLTVIGVQLFGFYLVGFAHSNLLPAIGDTLFVLLAFLLIIILHNTSGLYLFFWRYNRWILLMAILGVVAWVLVTFFGMGPVALVADRADGRLIANYILTFNKYKEAMDVGSLRYAGFFDEPGAMGYWGIFAMVINKLFIKDRRLESALSVLLIFTFSMGFYVQLLVYWALFSIGKIKWSQTIVTVAVFAIVVVGIYSTRGTALDAVYEISIGRMDDLNNQSREEGGTLEIGNRARLIENAKRSFHENVLFGGAGNFEIGNNIYEPLARYGIVGTFFIYFPFIFLLVQGIKNRKNRDLLKCTIVLIIGFTHRPFHNNVLSFFVVYSLIFMYLIYYKQINDTEYGRL